MMKKIFLAFALMASLSWVSASALTQAQVKAQEDSLSMAIGRIYGSSLAKMWSADAKASKQDFLEAFNLMISADTTRTSYMEGLEVGASVYGQIKQMKAQSGIHLDRALIASALRAAINAPVPADQEMMALNNEIRTRMANIEKARAEKLSADHQAKGKAYEASMLQQGFQKTASGLIYKMSKAGQGKTFGATDKVRLKYKGMHIDGTTFDESKDTVTMEVSRVVPGFKEALMLMSPGAELTAVIPASLAYGEDGAGKSQAGKYVIEPGETLVFNISTYAAKAPEPAAKSAPSATAPTGKRKPAARKGKKK